MTVSRTPDRPYASFSNYDNINWYRAFLLDLRYSITPDAYPTFAKMVAKALHRRHKFDPTPSHDPEGAEKGAAELDELGYTRLPQLLSPEEITEIRTYLEGQKVFNQWAVHSGEAADRENGDYLIGDVPEHVNAAEYPQKVMVSCPGLFKIANHPYVISMVEKYLGTTPTIQALQAWWSMPDRSEAQHAQLFHTDRHCYKFCKFFIYLTDVDSDTGPHVFVERSFDIPAIRKRLHAVNDPEAQSRFQKMLGAQRKADEDVADFFGSETLVNFEGPAGDMFIVNTAGIHKGMLPRHGRRLVFQVLYTMLPTIKDENPNIEYPGFVDDARSWFGDTYTEDKLLYMNRLMIRI